MSLILNKSTYICFVADVSGIIDETYNCLPVLVGQYGSGFAELYEGRDQLLELNSCRGHVAKMLIERLNELNQGDVFWSYMERLFDCYGVEREQEIEYLKNRTQKSHDNIQAAKLRLDAVRLIITS